MTVPAEALTFTTQRFLEVIRERDQARAIAVDLEQELARAERRAQNYDDIERLSHSATRGQLTKARKRADAGVCQHCHRTFANVARHVAGHHPEHANPTPGGTA